MKNCIHGKYLKKPHPGELGVRRLGRGPLALGAVRCLLLAYLAAAVHLMPG